MLTFTINSCDKGSGNTVHVNVHMASDDGGETVDIEIAGTEEEIADPNYILYQVAMLTKAFDSSSDSYGNIGEQLVVETYESLPLKEEISVL